MPPPRRSGPVHAPDIRRCAPARSADRQGHDQPLHAAMAARARATAASSASGASATPRSPRWPPGSARVSPEGDRSALPPAPTFTTGWQLGTPDLVLTPPGPFTLPAEGADTFWNVVLPASVDRTRYVRAIEILPGNRQVVHHANVVLDRSGMGRALDAKTPGVGFPGMDIEVVVGHVRARQPFPVLEAGHAADARARRHGVAARSRRPT